MKRIIALTMVTMLCLTGCNKPQAVSQKKADVITKSVERLSEEAKIEAFSTPAEGYQEELKKLAVIKQESKNRIIFLTADWCGHCQNMAPIIKQYISLHPESENLESTSENESTMRTLHEHYGVEGYPTIAVVDGDGNLVAKQAGEMQSVEEISAFLDANQGASGLKFEKDYDPSKKTVISFAIPQYKRYQEIGPKFEEWLDSLNYNNVKVRAKSTQTENLARLLGIKIIPSVVVLDENWNIVEKYTVTSENELEEVRGKLSK